VPEPGIYRDVPAAVYHSWKACSNSLLSHLVTHTPAHLKWAQDNHEEADALAFGEAFHASILEPDRFAREYAVAGQCEASKKSGDRCSNPGVLSSGGAWYCGVHKPAVIAPDGRKVISADDMEMLRGFRAAVAATPKLRRIIKDRIETELSIVWNDAATGVLCRGRIDAIYKTMIVDLKTTRDASRREFERAIFGYGYHRQIAFYSRGLAAHGIAADLNTIAAFEKRAPYLAAPYAIDDEALRAGDAQITPALERYAECLATNQWPGYSPDIQTISLPKWALNQITPNDMEQA